MMIPKEPYIYTADDCRNAIKEFEKKEHERILADTTNAAYQKALQGENRLSINIQGISNPKSLFKLFEEKGYKVIEYCDEYMILSWE